MSWLIPHRHGQGHQSQRILLPIQSLLSKHAIELHPPPISCHHRCCTLHHCPKLKVQQKSHHRLPINAYAVHCTAHAYLPSQLASFPYLYTRHYSQHLVYILHHQQQSRQGPLPPLPSTHCSTKLSLMPTDLR